MSSYHALQLIQWAFVLDTVKTKEDRYFELVSKAAEAGYSADTVTVEIGFRDFPISMA